MGDELQTLDNKQAYVNDELHTFDVHVSSSVLKLVNELGSVATKELIDSFIETYQSFFLDVEFSLNQQSFDKLENYAHSLKSNALYFGLTELHSFAAKLEVYASTNDADNIIALVNRFSMSLPRGLKRLEQFSAKLT